MESERLIVVSGDSHATMPLDAWDEYIEPAYRHLLPECRADNVQYTGITGHIFKLTPETLEVIDTEGRMAAGAFRGVWDLDTRLAEMDREGVAAEVVLLGDPRAMPPLVSTMRVYPQEVVASGTRSYHRWLADTFGPASHRLLLTGDPATAVDQQGILAELDWLAANGFSIVYLPNVSGRVEPLPPLYDAFWDPFWARCVAHGLVVGMHAGYGGAPAEFMTKLQGIQRKMEAAGGSDLLSAVLNNTEDFFALDLRPRRAMWHMMLGGVFDRFPDLRVIQCELRTDWLPATIAHLDAAYEKVRGQVPGKRKPSEYWHDNWFASLSFPAKVEIEMRHQTGLETLTFGRDYPHVEGTWPNTWDWMSGVFEGVPDDEVKLLLGENAMRFFRLDRERMTEIANRIGPTIDQIRGRPGCRDERMIANWNTRGQYLKQPEAAKPDEIDKVLLGDLETLGA